MVSDELGALTGTETLELALALAPDFPVFALDVVGQRSLADLITERLGIRHESPQVIMLKEGRPVWHASHSLITTAAILQAAEGITVAS
jgi:bacillithiol system protein YtxJ